MDVNLVGRNNLGDNAYRGNFHPMSFPSNSSNNYGNSYNNSYGSYNKLPLILRTILKISLVLKRISMVWLKKNCLRLMISLGTLIEFLLRLIFKDYTYATQA